MEDKNCRSLVINSANEMAVEAFLKGRIRFTEIYDIIESAYTSLGSAKEDSLFDILELDKLTRTYCNELMHKRSK